MEVDHLAVDMAGGLAAGGEVGRPVAWRVEVGQGLAEVVAAAQVTEQVTRAAVWSAVEVKVKVVGMALVAQAKEEVAAEEEGRVE